MPERINKAIELLEQGQPIYYTGKSERPSYESGKAMAKTWADCIALGHGARALSTWPACRSSCGAWWMEARPPADTARPPSSSPYPPMGPTSRSCGPTRGCANRSWPGAWHGVVLCHAENPAAVRAFVEACRYPYPYCRRGRWAG